MREYTLGMTQIAMTGSLVIVMFDASKKRGSSL